MAKMLKITWVDAQFLDLVGLCHPQDLDGVKSQECVIVGHLVKETETDYFIAKELWESGAFKYVHIIPKKMVKQVRELWE